MIKLLQLSNWVLFFYFLLSNIFYLALLVTAIFASLRHRRRLSSLRLETLEDRRELAVGRADRAGLAAYLRTGFDAAHGTAAGTMAPTIPERVAATAGLMPGSMPTTGMATASRSASADPAVPVLEPMTMALMPWEIRNRAIFNPRSRTNAGGLSPHGAFAESAT